MNDLSPAQAAEAVAAALSRPGIESVLAGFADVPGAVFVPSRPGGLFRRAEPARLELRQWRFVAGPRLLVSHVVRDVVLKTSEVGPAEGGRLLADAVLTAAGEAGPAASAEVQGLLYGLAVVYGLA
jgi:hypothetical protein